MAHFGHHSGDVVWEMKHASVDAVSGRAMPDLDRFISYQGYNDVGVVVTGPIEKSWRSVANHCDRGRYGERGWTMRDTSGGEDAVNFYGRDIVPSQDSFVSSSSITL